MIQPVTDDFLANLLTEVKNDQDDLSAVERFSQKHKEGRLPAQAKYYRDLLPASAPAEGQQYAFEVDLDRCTACKACVTACHNLNGLDETEAWRNTGTLTGGSSRKPFMQTITTACHHCLEPACATGCPVKAYDKDPLTGIVKHLDDQCIGCKYCTLTCPYDVPKYNHELGIVRKCDMCSQRLQEGEAPACVQACPSKAIRITVVDQKGVEKVSLEAGARILPGVPLSDHTKPTTRYVTKKEFPLNTMPADVDVVEPEHGHLPLVVMLSLTQAGAGGFCFLSLMPNLSQAASWSHSSLWLAALSFAVANTGLVAALFHLGRPQYAFRAILGIRTSWLSREIAAFSGFMGLAAASLFWIAAPLLPLPENILAGISSPLIGRGLVFMAALSGLAAVFTSVMVYHVTRRPCWNIKWTGSKFYLSTALTGSAMAWAVFSFAQPVHLLAASVFILSVVKMAVEWRQISKGEEASADPEAQTGWLLKKDLWKLTNFRFELGIFCGMLLPLVAILLPGMGSFLAVAALWGLFIAEAVERLLFFKSMTAARMPGNPTF